MSVNTIILILFFILITYLIIKKFFIKFIKEIKVLIFLKKYGKLAEGRVVDFHVDEDAEGTKLYFVICEFIANDKLFRIKSGHPLKEPPLVGSTLTLIYNVENPNVATTDLERTTSNYLLGLLFLIIALLLLLFLTLKSLGPSPGTSPTM